MVEQLHVTRCDDPVFLPFAKARIKSMRATGLRCLSQRFHIGEISVVVRIDGEHSYVSISGKGTGYFVWPRSFEHHEGYGEVVTATAALSSDGVKFRLGVKRETGTHDWLSYDGVSEDGSVKYGSHCITWSPGYKSRYNPRSSPAVGGETSTNVWVGKKKVNVGFVPAGVGRIQAVVDGVTETLILVAHFPAYNQLDIYFFKMSAVTDGAVTPTLIASHNAPGNAVVDPIAEPDVYFFYSQPVYFSGKDGVFATMVSAALPPFPSIVTLGKPQYYEVRGEVVVGSGGPTVSFANTTLFATSIYVVANDYVGVDVKPSGEVVVINYKTTANVLIPGTRAPGDTSLDTYSEYFINVYDEDGEIRYTPYAEQRSTSFTFTNNTRISRELYLNDSVFLSGFTDSIYEELRQEILYQAEASDPSSEPSSEASYHTDTVAYKGGGVSNFVIYDLDARFPMAVYVRDDLVRDPVSITSTWTRRFFPEPAGIFDLVNGPAVGTGAITRTITNEINTPLGDTYSRVYYSGPLAGIFNSTVPASGGLVPGGRRIATRRTGSFLASTTPFYARNGEVFADSIGALMEPNRTLNVAGHDGIVTEFVGWSSMKELGLPEGDTEATLFDIFISP